MKIEQIEKNNIETLKGFLKEQGYQLDSRQEDRMNEQKGTIFKISQSDFSKIMNDLKTCIEVNSRIQQQQLVKKVLNILQESISTMSIQTLQLQDHKMQIEDEEDEEFNYDLDIFEGVKLLKVQKEVPGQFKYTQPELFNLIKNYPEDYPQIKISFDNEINKQANIQRYENFENKFQKYLKTQTEFFKEIDEIPNQTVLIICRVIFGKPQNDDQSYQFLEYRIPYGFDYIEPELNTVTDYLIYPGQMLLLRGSFFMRKFQIEQIINNNSFSTLYLQNNLQTPLEKQCKVMFIKGPFFQNNVDLEDMFDNLKDILQDNHHNLLVVQGPIISFQNKTKSEKSTYKKLREDFLTKLQQHLQDQQIVFAENEDEIYLLDNIPLPSMKQNKFNKAQKKIITIPNPCILQLGDINIGLFTNRLYDDIKKNSLFKTSSETLKRVEVLRSLSEAQNLHPIFVPGDQTKYSLINEMNYDIPIDIFLLGTEEKETFAEKIDQRVFLCIKQFLGKSEFGQYGSVILSEKGIHSVRIFGWYNEQIIFNKF